MVQEIHQVLMDREDTCHRTCFSLHLDGNMLDHFSELRSVEGLQEGSVLRVVEGLSEVGQPAKGGRTEVGPGGTPPTPTAISVSQMSAWRLRTGWTLWRQDWSPGLFLRPSHMCPPTLSVKYQSHDLKKKKMVPTKGL